MSTDAPRRSALVILAAAALVAAAALRLGPLHTRAPGGLLDASVVSTLWSRIDTLGRGETLASILGRGGLTGGDASQALHAANGLDDRRVPAGMVVNFSGDSADADTRPREIVFQLSGQRALHLVRDGDAWSAVEERIPWTTDTLVVHGVVQSNLYDAIDAGAGNLLPKGARSELTWTLADIYEYRIDMSRELQKGDGVRVVFERLRSPAGAVRIGTILVAGLERRGVEQLAVRYEPRDGAHPDYYDGSGRSLRAAFLRAPLSFRRISSVFGMRLHPILGQWKAHTGTDYAAGSGTPVRAIGDGVVVFAGPHGGYGNSIDLRHPNGFVSRYGHLKAFAPGLHVGSRVSMGTTIAFVGMTGLATAPHLHFEILVGGVQRDPRTALKATGGTPLTGGDLARFEPARRAVEPMLALATGPVRSGPPGTAP